MFERIWNWAIGLMIAWLIFSAMPFVWIALISWMFK